MTKRNSVVLPVHETYVNEGAAAAAASLPPRRLH